MSEIIASHNLDTTCPYCGVGCGVSVKVTKEKGNKKQKILEVKGREAHPANYGRLCIKGSTLAETLDNRNRLLRPKIHGKDTSWDLSLSYCAEKFRQVIADHGPQAVAFYLSGQLLTEDYYVANKLIKGFLGTANVDTNSRLCMASAVVAHKRAFGADAVPGCYRDLEQAEVIFITGSNTAYAHPIVYQRIAKAKETTGCKIVVLDPRRTATCEIADLHLALKPGSDAFFFNGLLVYLAENDLLDHTYLRNHCDGFEQALSKAKSDCPNLSDAAKKCDLDEDELRNAYAWFGDHKRVVTLFSQGINQSSSGVDKGNAIINCHLATGKIGKPGAAPFSITGQPNAMGGREVGGLANQLAAHMSFDNPQDIARVATFWQAPAMAQHEGLKAVDMFKAVHRGEIKAIWIMATNPAVSMPDANFVKEALKRCELVMVSDCIANSDTAMLADVLLPASSWSEKHGTVTNSERCISLQRGFMPKLGEAKHDWQIICDFAKKMGFGKAFDYSHQVEIFREHAKLSGLDNHGKRAFDISALQDISLGQYENFSPTTWPINKKSPLGQARLYSDGQFYTANRRAQLVPVSARPPIKPASTQQVIMNTGRIRDQWHSMTHTGAAPRLLGHIAEPYVQISPNDAKRFKLTQGGFAKLSNLGTYYLGRVKITSDQRDGEIFSPMHWNNAYSSAGRVDALVNPLTDPLSGQPEFKHCPVTIEPYLNLWQGFLLVSDQISDGNFAPPVDYWSRVTIARGQKFIVASTEQLQTVGNQKWLEKLFPNIDDWIYLQDSEAKASRWAGFLQGKLALVLFAVDSEKTLVDSNWLQHQLGQTIDPKERLTLLSGAALNSKESVGAIICSCFQIGENTINTAITNGQCTDVAQLGKSLKCGTNCGSCIPELKAMLAVKSTLVT